MSDRPILFSAPMVRALLAGRKTQTRRVLKVPLEGARFGGIERDGQWLFTKSYSYSRITPPFTIGDRLWVREAWRAHKEWDSSPPRDIPHDAPIQYFADEPNSPWDSRYRQARFMCRWMSRMSLLVTDVRVERLQSISEADAIAEGVEQDGCFFGAACDGYDAEMPGVAAYRRLWNSIHGEGAWDANPWVVAISFERENAQ